MIKFKLLSLIIYTIVLSLFLKAQNNVCFTIEVNSNNSLAFSGFTKFVSVLDCFQVYAEPTISDAKILHAAAVAAELLDNNEDGIVDDVLLNLGN